MNRIKGICIIFLLLLIFPAASNADCISVKRAQTILKNLNYYPDAVDGLMGMATGKAISTFQIDKNLSPTGKLNRKTCKKLISEEKKLQKAKAKKSTSSVVLRAQKKLKALHYYNGPLNGEKDPVTRGAVISFQSTHSLNPSGILDKVTLKTLFSKNAKPAEQGLVKPVKKKTTGPENVANTKTNKKNTPVSVKKTKKQKKLTLGYSLQYLSYLPDSTYDDTTYEAINDTLHPEQAVDYKEETFLVHRLTASMSDYVFSLATSQLTGGEDNNALFADFIWFFNRKDNQYLLRLDYSSIESDVEYDSRVEQIKTTGLNFDLLYMKNPTIAYGLNLTYQNYPTLVSCKSKDAREQDIQFDKDFVLSTINFAFYYDSANKDVKPVYKTKNLYPYLNAGLFAGLSCGSVSDETIDSLSQNLNHSFSGNIYGINLKVSPEAGLKYKIHKPGYDLELHLGYQFTYNWPLWSLWSLPMMATEDEVYFYRRDLSHGPVLGCTVTF